MCSFMYQIQPMLNSRFDYMMFDSSKLAMYRTARGVGCVWKENGLLAENESKIIMVFDSSKLVMYRMASRGVGCVPKLEMSRRDGIGYESAESGLPSNSCLSMSRTNNVRNTTSHNLRSHIAQLMVQPEFPLYTPAHVAGITVGMNLDNLAGLSFDARMAAARAAIRANAHKDGTDYRAKTDGGLHPFYVSLHGKGTGSDIEKRERQELLSATLTDVFDTISILDRVDGGISLFLHCPGHLVSRSGAQTEDITVDTYVSPREVHEGGGVLREAAARLIQAFGAQVALPHLHRFTSRCYLEDVLQVPTPFVGNQIPYATNSYLPPFEKSGNDSKNGHLRVRCKPDLDSRVPLRASVSAPLAERSTIGDLSTRAIIDIRDRTNAVIDRFQLGDGIIPRLRKLACETRSGRWEAVMRGPEWGLSYEQAVNLSQAMMADIAVAVIKRKSPAATGNLGICFMFTCATVIVALIVTWYIASA
ncbi:hypothetical protein F5887DRAFT_924648 [Amanita rubescens]|nr:hypothetical protein F5887DRAFT_924648 [Amanita rubescens]